MRNDSEAFDLLATPPRVCLANFYPFKPGEEAGRHWSESNLFLPVTHGRGAVQVGPRRFELSAGQVLHVPWASPLLYRAERADPFTVIGIHLSYAAWSAPPQGRPLHTRKEFDIARETMQRAPGPQPFRGPFALSPPPASSLLDLAAAIAHAYESGAGEAPQADREARLRGLALAFLVEFRACARGAGRPEALPRATAAQWRTVREIASFMELNLTRGISRAELAERAGASESTLAAAFRAVTGQGPIDYLIGLRVARAQRLLRTGRARIGEIAAQTGIPDVYHFSKLFKKRVGCSPLAYRQRLRI